jgi:cysteinylglycine-S-conjugate dipeptidase
MSESTSGHNPTQRPAASSSSHTHSPACGCNNEKGQPLFAAAPSQATHKALEQAEKEMRSSLEDLRKLVEIPSVSLAGFEERNVSLCAEATAELLTRVGLEKVELIQFGDVHPYVYGEWMHKPDAPTILLYAHHDVQPPGREEKWTSDPFKAVEKNGRLYGRGTADDKAGIIAHTAAIAAFLRTSGELPVNVKVLIEGEEEIGSRHLAEFVSRHKQALRADAMVLTDCANLDSGIPSITTALRGMVAADIEIETLAHPVHSGLWGGILPDPVLALAQILGKLADHQGNILIPGILDDVRGLPREARERLQSSGIDRHAREATGILQNVSFVCPPEEFAERLWHRPSLSINAIQSGSRKLVSNIIQDGAWARVSIRTVPDMKPEKIHQLLRDYVQKICPPGFRVKVTPERNGDWWVIDNPNAEVYQIAARALEKGYGHSTQFIGCGASIPFVEPLSKELGGIPAILVGVEDPYTNAHSENESLNLLDFRSTILGQVHMLADLARYRRQ